MERDIIDFHTHPYLEAEDNISAHKEYIKRSPDVFISELAKAGINKFCGSVIRKDEGVCSMISSNDHALLLKEKYGDSYIPGFMIDARFLEESKREMDRALKYGIKLIGELVPYHYSWKYSDKGFYELLDYAEGKGLIFSLHTADELDVMTALAKSHPETTFVFAHPGELNRLLIHIKAMKESKNVYLDLSGTGLFRYGMLKRLVEEVGADRILFGSDYPVCNAGMYVGGVEFEDISEDDKRLIFSENAKKILGF